jgi:uncharacterized protein YbjT (DUF2867 family)
MTPRKLFIAGGSGAIGRTMMPLVPSTNVPYVAHFRPKAGRASDANTAIFELSDRQALDAALQGCTTIIQLIGTMKSRFGSGDTYETSDIGTTQQLAEAGRAAGVDHFVLLSSVGAGSQLSAYLKAKGRAEDITKQCFPSTHTIFRPSAFQGEGHNVPAFAKTFTRLLSLRKYEPIRVEQLASAILHVAVNRIPVDSVLEGETLWGIVAASHGFGWGGA